MNLMVVVPVVAAVWVAALIGVVAFVFRDGGRRTATRLDMLIGKRRREDDAQQDILRKSAFENDKKSFMELITPKFLSPQKYFEQADCHIKPSTLFGIGLVLATAGATMAYLAKLPLIMVPITALSLFCLPLLWLWNNRRVPLNKFPAHLPHPLSLAPLPAPPPHSLHPACHP